MLVIIEIFLKTTDEELIKTQKRYFINKNAQRLLEEISEVK